MRITIQSEGKLREFNVPNGLIFNPVTARLLISAAKNRVPEALKKLDARGCTTVLGLFYRLNHDYRGWPLVEVETAGGERIEITI